MPKDHMAMEAMEAQKKFKRELEEFLVEFETIRSGILESWKRLSGWLGAQSKDNYKYAKRRLKEVLRPERIELLMLLGRKQIPDYIALSPDGIILYPSEIMNLKSEERKKLLNPERCVELLDPPRGVRTKRLRDLNRVEFRQILGSNGRLLERAEQQAKLILPIRPSKEEERSLPVARDFPYSTGKMMLVRAWPDGDPQNVSEFLIPLSKLKL